MLSISLATLFCIASTVAGTPPQDTVTSVQEPAADERLTADHVRFPGTRLFLVPPDGFVHAGAFTGYQHLESDSSIMLTAIPGPFPEVSGGFDDEEESRRRGIRILEREERPMADADGLLLRMFQQGNGLRVAKVMWIFGTETQSVMIIAQCPVEAADTWMPILEAAVLGAVWQPDLVIDPLEGMPFVIEDTAGMQLFTATAGTLNFTSDGEADEGKLGKPLFICAPALRSSSGDREKQFRRRLRGTPLRKEKVQGELAEVTIDGLPGLAGLATRARSTRSCCSTVRTTG